MKRFMVAVASGLVLTACGSTSIGPGSNPTPSPSPGMGFDVTVTEKDHTAAMHVGQRIEVVLHAVGGMNDWAQPKSSNEAVLAPIVDPAATAVRGVTLAAFQARTPGDAEISSYAGPVCASGQACPAYLMALSIKVTVTA